jgi:hypothetical protein
MRIVIRLVFFARSGRLLQTLGMKFMAVQSAETTRAVLSMPPASGKIHPHHTYLPWPAVAQNICRAFNPVLQIDDYLILAVRRYYSKCVPKIRSLGLVK